MSTPEPSSSTPWKLILGGALLLVLIAVAGMLASMRDMLRPLPAPPDDLEPDAAAAPVRPAREAAASAGVWSPLQPPTDTGPAPAAATNEIERIAGHTGDAEMLDVETHGRQMQALQISALRQKLATPSADENEQRVSETEIQEMEKQGVLIW
jgi:hypothetical protein